MEDVDTIPLGSHFPFVVGVVLALLMPVRGEFGGGAQNVSFDAAVKIDVKVHEGNRKERRIAKATCRLCAHMLTLGKQCQISTSRLS